MPSRTTTFDTWLAYSDDTAAKRAVAGKYGVDFRTPEPSKAHLLAMRFLREACERRPKMVKFNGEQFDYLENAIYAQMQVERNPPPPDWDNCMMTSQATAQVSIPPPPFSSSSNSTVTPTNAKPRAARVVSTQPELTMTPITPTVSMKLNHASTANYGMGSMAGHDENALSRMNTGGEPAPMIMPYGVTYLKGDPNDNVFVSKTARNGSGYGNDATQAWSQESLHHHQQQQQQQEYHHQQMQQHFQTHQPSPLAPRNLQHHLHQENQKQARSPTSPRKTGGLKRPSGHSTAPTDMATNPASRQRPRIQVSTSSTPLGFPQAGLNSAGGVSTGSTGSTGAFQLDDARLSKQLASLEVRGESMSPSSTTRTHPPNGLSMPSAVQQAQSQPFVVPSQAHLFPDRSCQDMNPNSWDAGNYWTNGIATDESELTW